MEEKRMGRTLVCRLISAADEEYATRTAFDLVREKLTLLLEPRSAASGSR